MAQQPTGQQQTPGGFAPQTSLAPYSAYSAPMQGYNPGMMPFYGSTPYSNGPQPPALAGLLNVQQAVGAVGSIIQLVGVNAQSVQQVSTAFLGLLEAAGQAAGEVAGVLGAPRSIGSSTAPSAAAEADHHRMQRRRVLRWGIGLVVLLGGYHAFRGLAGSAGSASDRARRRLSWLQVACHLLVLLASAGAGYGVGPQALLEGGRSAIDALKAVAKGEDPLALPPPDASSHGDQPGPGDGQGANTTDEAAGGAAAAAEGGAAASPVRRAVMSPADARAILHSVMEGESDSDAEEGGEGGGDSLPAVVEASPMVPGSAAGTPAQATGLPFAGGDVSEPAAQRTLDF